MPFLCCQSPQTAIDPGSHSPRLNDFQGSVVIASIEDVPANSRNNATGHNPREEWGVVLKHESINRRQHVVIEKIHADSCLKTTPLQEGMILFQINNFKVDNQTLPQIDHLLRTAQRPLKLWARTRSFPDSTTSIARSRGYPTNRSSLGTVSTTFDAKLILAVAHKEKVDQMLGLSLKQCPDEYDSGIFIVDTIHPASPFYPHNVSLLREGMIVSSINGLSITGMDKEVALSAIRDAPGSVIIAAQVPPDMEEPRMIRKRVVATIYKDSADAPLGLSLIRIPQGGGGSSGGGGASTKSHDHRHRHGGGGNNRKNNKFFTVVGRIAPTCPFSTTELAVGMEIKTINGMDVSKSDAKEILNYLQESCGKIVVWAEMDVPAEDMMVTVAAGGGGL